MERVQIKISGDGLEAALQAGKGAPCSREDLDRLIARAGIRFGIDEQAVGEAARRLADPMATVNLRIAVGLPPIHGENGRIEGPRSEEPLAGEVHADSSIDYRERHLLRPTDEGQRVATIVPPTPGTPGRGVTGRAIAPEPGRPHPQQPGDGVRIEDDAILATRSGVVLCTERKIDVVDLYRHEGDVDYDSGNLRTRGSLEVRGDVCEGFSVEAQGDVAITGAVLDAEVRAGGSAEIGLGVLGRRASVRAEKDISCRHATAARLVAGERIDLGDQTSMSSLAAPRIRATNGRGAAFGGELRARESIDVLTAGSPGGGTTVLAVGQLLDEEVELARKTAAAARLDRKVIHSRRKGIGKPMAEKRAATRAADLQRIAALQARERQLELLRTAHVCIYGTCHPGVVIRFGNHELRPNDPLQGKEFRFDPEGRSIVIGDIHEL